LSGGCIAQQADLKQTEKTLQQRIKQSSDESAQTRARQSQEISALREEELPKLQGKLDQVSHQAQELQGKQEDLKQRSAVLEQQTKKLEQLAGKSDAENANRYAQLRESLNAQDVKGKVDRDQFRTEMNSRLDDVNKQMETLRKELIEAVQKTNSALMKGVDTRLEEQRKAAVDSQNRSDLLATKFAQFSQALTGFRDSLTGMSERLAQEEQANKALSTKVETDIRASTTLIN
jgi:chromosome segregation ATPase